MYKKLITEADQTGQPARGAKCRGIRREAKERMAACTNVPTLSELLDLISKGVRPRIHCFHVAIRTEKYGRSKCRDMIDSSLPVVVAYDPETDSGWPY